MVETAAFQLKRHENILSSLAGYLSGHTEFINDFSEGSITRSLLEGISQELYRQNLAYAQGITDAIRTSIKQAFNQPLLQASKSYGLFTAYRSLLPAPTNLSVSFSSSSAIFKGYISGTTLTVSTVSSGKIFLGQGISGTNIISGTIITGFVGGTGGIGTYTINNTQSLGSSSDLKDFFTYGTFSVPTNFKLSSTIANGSVPIGTYYYGITAVFGSTESVSTVPFSVTLSSSAQNIVLTWTSVPNATGYKIYRSTNSNMISSSYYSISGQSTVTYTDVYATATPGKWPGTAYWWGVSAKNYTNNNTLQSAGSYIKSVPSGAVATLSWSEVTSGDVASSPIGYNVYRSNYDLSLSSVDNFVVSGASGGSLNFGSTFSGYILGTTLTVSNVVSGSLSIGQILSHSSIANGTTIVSGSGTSWVVDISQSSGTALSPLSGIIGSIIYYYRVTAITGSGEGVPSERISFVPTSTQRTASLSWNPIIGASGYRIYRSTNYNFSSVMFAETIAPYFSDNNTQFISGEYPSIIYIGSTSSSVYSFVDSNIKSSMITSSAPVWPLIGQAFSVQGPIIIPGGTQLFVAGSSKRYVYPSSVTMNSSDSYISSVIECTNYGSFGNTGANTISFISNQIYGISSGTNLSSFITGTDIETEEQWKTRFASTLKDLSRGTRESITVGALSSRLYDQNKFISEQVTKALVIEPSNQVVNLYIFDGTNQSTSVELIAQTQKIINGYINEQGERIAGYKPAGIPVTVLAAAIQYQSITAEIITDSGYSLLLVKDLIEKNIQQYFEDLDISDGFQIPSITSITPVGSSGSSVYTYKIVGIDNNGNYSLPSDSKIISNASEPFSNLLTWTNNSSGPNILYYDILRWDGIQWGLVATVETAGATTITYTDSNISLNKYSFVKPSINYFQKSVLNQIIMRTPGVASVKLTVPDLSNIDQTTIIPPPGTILLLSSVFIK